MSRIVIVAVFVVVLASGVLVLLFLVLLVLGNDVSTANPG
jgi:hypothetical protein